MKVLIQTTRHVTLKSHTAKSEVCVLYDVLEKHTITKNANAKRAEDILHTILYYAKHERGVIELVIRRMLYGYELFVWLITRNYARKFDILTALFDADSDLKDFVSVNGSPLILFALQNEKPDTTEYLLSRGCKLVDSGMFVCNRKQPHLNVFRCAHSSCEYILYRAIDTLLITRVSLREVCDLIYNNVPAGTLRALGCVTCDDPDIIELAAKTENLDRMRILSQLMTYDQKVLLLQKITKGAYGVLFPCTVRSK